MCFLWANKRKVSSVSVLLDDGEGEINDVFMLLAPCPAKAV